MNEMEIVAQLSRKDMSWEIHPAWGLEMIINKSMLKELPEKQLSTEL